MSAVASQITGVSIVYSTVQVVQAEIVENIKAPRHWPLCAEFYRWPVNSPRTKGPRRGKVSIRWRHHDINVCDFVRLPCASNTQIIARLVVTVYRIRMAAFIGTWTRLTTRPAVKQSRRRNYRMGGSFISQFVNITAPFGYAGEPILERNVLLLHVVTPHRVQIQTKCLYRLF